LGLFFNLQECKCLYSRLKKEEAKLADDELFLLNRLQKMLYSVLSIREIEDLETRD